MAAGAKELYIGERKRLGDITFIYHLVMHSLLADMSHHKRKQAMEKTPADSGIPYAIHSAGCVHADADTRHLVNPVKIHCRTDFPQ